VKTVSERTDDPRLAQPTDRRATGSQVSVEDLAGDFSARRDLHAAEMHEINRLRDENRRLREENRILLQDIEVLIHPARGT
jgi:transposase-like protein